jgi:hypothetical protein
MGHSSRVTIRAAALVAVDLWLLACGSAAPSAEEPTRAAPPGEPFAEAPAGPPIAASPNEPPPEAPPAPPIEDTDTGTAGRAGLEGDRAPDAVRLDDRRTSTSPPDLRGPHRPHPIQRELGFARPALRRCSERAELLTEAFATCACAVMCRQRFTVAVQDPESGPTTVRVPFVDVDGLSFQIEPDGTVSSCRYTVGARTLADVSCASSQ